MVEGICLSDVIDYQKDIAPFRFVEIHAGPGAGKNTLIEMLAKGEMPGAPKMRVLLITSRRAKVDETFKTYLDSDNESLSLFKEKIGMAWDVVDQKGQHVLAGIGNTICTSAFIAGYLKRVYRKDDVRTHLWEMYDVIAVDEVHSVMLDATYQDAPFYIYDLINHYLDRCNNEEYPDPICKHVILMTGTPEPLTDYFPADGISATLIDKMDECTNIQPQNVHFVEMQQVVRLLKSVVQENKRCIYFGNQIDRIQSLYGDKQLPKEKMVMSFSKEEKRTELRETDEQSWKNMVATEESIKDNYKIPEQFSVLLTTSRYREGINIKDNIDAMVIESHNTSDVIQMAGRVRSGVKDLYLVVDAMPHPTDYAEEVMENKLALIQIYGSTDRREKRIKDKDGNIDKRCYPLNFMLNEVPANQLGRFIQFIEGKFRYIRYSYLYDSFMMYDPRATGVNYVRAKNAEWENAWKNHSLPQMVQGWFPDAVVEEFLSERDRKYQASWQLWNKHGFELDVIYSNEIVNNFKNELGEVWGTVQINRALKKFSSYKCVNAGKKNRGYKFVDDK